MNRAVVARIALVAGFVFVAVAVVFGGGQEVSEPRTSGEAARYVTVTFDDGYRSQYDAANALEDRGMRGVFYVSAGLLNGSFEGIPTMSAAQVQELHVRGHEIGGHTYNHTDISTLSAAQVQQTIAQNQAALNEMGIRPVSFAYPYGQGTENVPLVADSYAYARTVQWQINRFPPDNPYALHTLALTEQNHEHLDGYMDRLEPGDWLVIAIHHVEDGPVTRPDVDVTQETYETILDTLHAADVEIVTFQDVQGLER